MKAGARRLVVTGIFAAGIWGAGTASLAQEKGVVGAMELARDGKSAFSIYHVADAPPSVVEAAAELQRVLEVSTGAKLSIVQAPTPAMICLGATARRSVRWE